MPFTLQEISRDNGFVFVILCKCCSLWVWQTIRILLQTGCQKQPRCRKIAAVTQLFPSSCHLTISASCKRWGLVPRLPVKTRWQDRSCLIPRSNWTGVSVQHGAKLMWTCSFHTNEALVSMLRVLKDIITLLLKHVYDPSCSLPVPTLPATPEHREEVSKQLCLSICPSEAVKEPHTSVIAIVGARRQLNKQLTFKAKDTWGARTSAVTTRQNCRDIIYFDWILCGPKWHQYTRRIQQTQQAANYKNAWLSLFSR